MKEEILQYLKEHGETSIEDALYSVLDNEIEKEYALQILKMNPWIQEIVSAYTQAAQEMNTFLNIDNKVSLYRRIEERRQGKNNTQFIFIDVNKFKAYNDLYGHEQADVVIKLLAKTIDKEIRRLSDCSTHSVGGDEFVVFLPDTTDEGAKIVANRIREAIQDLHITHEGDPSGELTIALGSASDLESSDFQMYKNKKKQKVNA